MFRELDEKRADKVFLDLSMRVCEYRAVRPDVTDTEIAYALLQTVASIDQGGMWEDFLHEALDECISQEKY